MKNKKLKKIFFIIISFVLLTSLSYAEVVKKIIIKGNQRVSNETIKLFSLIKVGDEITTDKLNEIIDNLYITNFFDKISTNFENQELIIEVEESPIINKIQFKGVKSKTLIDSIRKNLKLKSRSSYNKFQVETDKLEIISDLKNRGYYYSTIEVFKELQNNNSINLVYKIDLGNKAKIKKIIFNGNKIYKDSKLRSIIVSEEYKFWKFISGKKYLNENIINIDNRLLKNFYLNQGYVNVNINSSFAKSVSEDSFELIFNINANEQIFFNEFALDLPNDFNPKNYEKINSLFKDLSGKPYSINAIEKILKKINDISIFEQYVSSEAFVEETVFKNKIDLKFTINESDTFFVDKINIFGNNVTKEEVIRNQLEVDEGDPFNEILLTRSINNIKSLNFFKNVDFDIKDNKNNQNKTINLNVEEKPTGEIMAGAGFGTSGTTTTKT